MQAYTLTEEYPGSPKPGTIITQLNEDYWGVNGFMIQKDIMLKFNKFWKSKELKYEILSLSTNTFVGVTFSKVDISSFFGRLPSTKDWTIRSVRRLRDGVVFTVGDRVEHHTSAVDCGKIESLEIASYDSQEIHVKYGSEDHVKRYGRPGIFTNSLGVLVKTETPLLKTEDGFEVFHKDTVLFSVCPKGSWEQSTNNAQWAKNATVWKHFMTKEARREYIMTYKPCLSLHDLNQIFSMKNLVGYPHLEKLIQSKV